MGVIVSITYATWITAYPQFSTTVSQAAFDGMLFPLAQQYVRNDGGGPVCNAGTQTQLLNLMLAHLATLFYGVNGGSGPSPLVGRINSATEGSVSVSAEMPTSQQAAWFMQTPAGAAFWQLALPFRLGRYFPKITQQFQPLASPWPGVYSTPGGR